MGLAPQGGVVVALVMVQSRSRADDLSGGAPTSLTTEKGTATCSPHALPYQCPDFDSSSAISLERPSINHW
jgi:hypothetical protein